MKAVIYRKDRGLVVEEVPVPEPGKDAVLVKVSDTGFCGSDHSLIESGLLADGTILRHEASGIVAGRGKAVSGPGRNICNGPAWDQIFGKPRRLRARDGPGERSMPGRSSRT